MAGGKGAGRKGLAQHLQQEAISIGRSLLEGWSESSLALDAEARVLLLRSSTAIGEVAAIALAPGGVSLEEFPFFSATALPIP